jgi:UDP-N-acetylmuramyl pentapeptide phosphotransferase/UDP-N-acetylglucosamine-1-phosphate transferase
MTAALVLDPSQFLRQAAVPLGLAYAGLVFVLMVYGRAHRSGNTAASDAHPRPDGPDTARRQLVVTVGGGYVVFLAVTLGYYSFVARQTSSFVFQAVTGGAFMAFVIVLPGFVLLSWIEEVLLPRLHGRSGRP